ncbi:TPA_asm: host-nuclease inhibitor protein Gam [Salmonella enterica subsp. enterica serovar Dublin]|uniref:Host-nuclease inhibitor protein Gam n=1 Tax=Salmonella dublin TaxID=98360 RepID=A0A732GUR1_SALDU|nr:host-nuclease inhibitor protein Gam [Salmonella enterica subsp. enterica serovar Enteritidis]EKR1395133.1 host-nuclease inhibitor protein Gam [Salmonella enterica subsp. enterica serovar Dublin]EKR1404298.1 host-nuclease inhibitor protein Gam [Salmonella enterica subsp. enterica serovar Dublin]HAC6853199.1 host-nuclease inhibitor protein Gam [Salmonella enterica subsp. enterica serovar Dublin]HAE4979137.1 host-nuclease inhibitor protein Gam [Salmonella enterica subsp. enterica serovar Dublin
MNAYLTYDRIEAQDWTRHYQQIAREEKESELADDLEKGLSLHMLESLCIDELQRRGASKQAISRAFDDDVEFQERASEFMRYMAETFSRHQIDIESEE